jgi:hypothetical protein
MELLSLSSDCPDVAVMDPALISEQRFSSVTVTGDRKGNSVVKQAQICPRTSCAIS